MADLSDVTVTLASLASAALYPNGTAQPSVADVTVSVVPGWPLPKQLDAEIAAGNAFFSVYPMPGMDQNVTRFLGEDPVPLVTPTPSLSLTVTANTVTVGGAIFAGEAAMVSVNNTPYTYPVQPIDTLASVATALAAAIPGASVAGDIVTIGGDVYALSAAVSAVASLQVEIARQRRVFMLTAWCPTAALRDTISKSVDVNFKAIPGRRIVLQDQTYGILIYRGTLETDALGTRNIYRRDLRYEVEYATTQQSTSNTITNTQISLTPDGGSIVAVNSP